MRRKIFVLGLLVLYLIGNLRMYGQKTAAGLSLPQLIDSALQNNDLLKANEKSSQLKRIDLEILKAEYQPSISTSASFSYWKFLLPNKQKLLGDALTDMYTDISVYQMLYDWGEIKLKKSIVGDDILINKEIRKQIRSTIVWGVSNAYFDILRAEMEIATHHNALQQLNSHLQYANNLYSVGAVSIIDVFKIKMQILEEEKASQKAQNTLHSQLIKIKRLCYLNDEVAIFTQDVSQTLFPSAISLSLKTKDLYDLVIENNPVLLEKDYKIDKETKQKAVLGLQNRPTLFSYGIGSWEDGYIPFGNNFNYNIGVGLRYNLPYLGGNGYKSKMLQSDYMIEILTDEKNFVFNDIKKEIDLAMNTLDDIKGEISSNEKIIALSSETLNNALIKYQSGQGSVIDILDAQTILTETTIALEKSKIFYLQTLVKLNYVTGSDNYPFSLKLGEHE